MKAALFAIMLGLLAGTAVQAETLAITHARLDGADAAVTIVMRDGRVTAMGPDSAIPPDARVLDAAGKTVTRGLIHSATQLGIVEVASASDTVDGSAKEQELGPAFDVRYAVNRNSMLLPIARADGLTRAVIFPDASAVAPFSGMGALLRLADHGTILEQARIAEFVRIGGAASSDSGQSRAADWGTLRNALDEARAFKAGAVKNDGRAAWEPLLERVDVEALQPVIEGRMPIAIFTERESDIREALRLAADYKLRIIIMGGSEAWRLADELAAQKIPVVLDPFANLPQTFDVIGARLDNAAILQKAGVLIAFYTSSIAQSYNAGSSLREGAGIAVANGLSWDAALAAITVNPQKIWGIETESADFVIWDGDPLEPMSAPLHVIIRGQDQSLQTRQDALAKRYHPAATDQRLPPSYRK